MENKLKVKLVNTIDNTIDKTTDSLQLPPPLRRQVGITYNCYSCNNNTSNSCKLCCGCHKRGDNDLSPKKINCSYISCKIVYKKDNEKFLLNVNENINENLNLKEKSIFILEDIPLRRQRAESSKCTNCNTETSNSCYLCNTCHKRGDNDESYNKVTCSYKTCKIIYKTDTSNYEFNK